MAEASEFEFKLADGSVVKAADMAEGFKTLAKMKEDTAAALKAAREEQASLQSRLDAMQMQIQQQQAPPPTNGNGFNRTQFYSKLNEVPEDAVIDAIAYKLGIPPEQLPGYFQNIDRSVSDLQQNMLAASFTAMHDDFPQTAESAKILTQEVVRLKDEGHPVNLNTMDMAWQNCISQGKIKPLEAQETQIDDQLPPSLPSGGSSTIPSDVAKADDLPDKDLEALLRSKGMIR
jgi:small-conductance mechanosensitive channel